VEKLRLRDFVGGNKSKCCQKIDIVHLFIATCYAHCICILLFARCFC